MKAQLASRALVDLRDAPQILVFRSVAGRVPDTCDTASDQHVLAGTGRDVGPGVPRVGYGDYAAVMVGRAAMLPADVAMLRAVRDPAATIDEPLVVAATRNDTTLRPVERGSRSRD